MSSEQNHHHVKIVYAPLRTSGCLDKFLGREVYEVMAITVAEVLEAKGSKPRRPRDSRAALAGVVGVSSHTLSCWVVKGSIPAKYVWALSGPFPFNLDNPDFRKLFGLVEPCV